MREGLAVGIRIGKDHIQRVGESGRPYLPWKQGTASSNLAALTNYDAVGKGAVPLPKRPGTGRFPPFSIWLE